MRINKKYYIFKKREDNIIFTNIFKADDEQKIAESSTIYSTCSKILAVLRSRTYTVDQKNTAITRCYNVLGFNAYQILDRLLEPTLDEIKSNNSDIKYNTTINEVDPAVVTRAIQSLIQFFSEFNFTPSFRFLNSLALSKNKKQYVKNYFVVQDHPYTAEISEKIKSVEFSEITKTLEKCSPKPINTRFELYFGEPGTGKTTKAMKLADKCIVCASDMLPVDLMQNFAFDDGKAAFQKSDLWIAMEEGKTIVLDEVNMLPFESLRFLQGITDGKETIDYKGFNIKIKPGFKIYATMNLNVNGQCIPLPAPLVDRSYEIVEFKLSAKDLLSALI